MIFSKGEKQGHNKYVDIQPGSKTGRHLLIFNGGERKGDYLLIFKVFEKNREIISLM